MTSSGKHTEETKKHPERKEEGDNLISGPERQGSSGQRYCQALLSDPRHSVFDPIVIRHHLLHPATASRSQSAN